MDFKAHTMVLTAVAWCIGWTALIGSIIVGAVSASAALYVSIGDVPFKILAGCAGAVALYVLFYFVAKDALRVEKLNADKEKTEEHHCP